MIWVSVVAIAVKRASYQAKWWDCYELENLPSMVPPHVADEKLWSMGVFYKSKKGRSHCNTEQISIRFESVKVAVQTSDTWRTTTTN